MANHLLALDYFAGGVPAGATLSLQLNELQNLTQQKATTRHRHTLIFELAFIGLLSYFEAFCKDHFASIINILPDLIQRLRNHGHDTTIDVTGVSHMGEHFTHRVGFLLAEKYDFGTPRKFNTLYHSLVQVSPFSGSEVKKFDKLLADRNLIVHHGGIYTMKYAQQILRKDIGKDIFYNSLVLDTSYFDQALALISDISEKTVKSTHRSVQETVRQHRINLNPEQERAINFLEYWPPFENDF